MRQVNAHKNNHIYKLPNFELYRAEVCANCLSWAPVKPVTKLFKEEKPELNRSSDLWLIEITMSIYIGKRVLPFSLFGV